MKQKNGFVFIETIIVIAVLTTALVLLYSMFTSVLNQEKRRTTYEDVAYLYRTYYLSKFYNDVAKRSITYGIDEKNPMVSIPLVSDASKGFIPEEEQGFYENLMNSSFGITNVYLAGKDIDKLEKCDPDITSCDVLEDLAGSNWKSYLKTLYKNDTYQLITVFGIGENKNGSACFDVFNGNTSVDSTCKFYYSSVPLHYAENAVAKLTELAKTNTEEMFIDDTVDANIRYMGKNPNNYVDLGDGNDEDGSPILWRIIGVMNNVDDGTGHKETRIKVIREKSVGAIIWDAKCNGTFNEITGECDKCLGLNDEESSRVCSSISYNNNWATSSLSRTLNEAFYNSAKSSNPNYATINKNPSQRSDYKWQKLDFSANGLGNVNKDLIAVTVYHLGGPTSSNYNTLTVKEYYEAERSNTVYSGNPTTWTGKVGLMYPSDYGYASIETNKIACATLPLAKWGYSCADDNNNWLHDSFNSFGKWTMTPLATGTRLKMIAESTAGVHYTDLGSGGGTVTYEQDVHPVLYLKSNAKIIDGDGSRTNPYKIVS